MNVEDLMVILSSVPANTPIVGEECFKSHHNLKLVHAGMGQDGKFVLFFKDSKSKDYSIEKL